MGCHAVLLLSLLFDRTRDFEWGLDFIIVINWVAKATLVIIATLNRIRGFPNRHALVDSLLLREVQMGITFMTAESSLTFFLIVDNLKLVVLIDEGVFAFYFSAVLVVPVAVAVERTTVEYNPPHPTWALGVEPDGVDNRFHSCGSRDAQNLSIVELT